MSEQQTLAHECPLCREAIKEGASRCPHCQADIPPGPTHGGTCPLCRESIHPEAIRCFHCKSDLTVQQRPRAFATRAGRMRIRRTATYASRAHCPPAIMDGSEMWCLYAETDEYCEYEKCGYV
jgi:hypothetical protein